MMLGLRLSSATQIHTVIPSLLVALAVVLVVQYLGLRGAEAGRRRSRYAPLSIPPPWASTAFRYAVGHHRLHRLLVASWQMKTDIKNFFLWFCLLAWVVSSVFARWTSSRCSCSTGGADPDSACDRRLGRQPQGVRRHETTLMLMGGSALLIGILGICWGGRHDDGIQEIAALHNDCVARCGASGFRGLWVRAGAHSVPDDHASAPAAIINAPTPGC